MICAMGFFLFSLAVNYLSIFEDEHHEAGAHEISLPESLTAVNQPTMVN
jgi:hypothetical protein